MDFNVLLYVEMELERMMRNVMMVTLSIMMDVLIYVKLNKIGVVNNKLIL